jgi:hypothetical protein
MCTLVLSSPLIPHLHTLFENVELLLVCHASSFLPCFPCFGVCVIDNYRCTYRSLTLFLAAKLRQVQGHSIVVNSLTQNPILLVLSLSVCLPFALVFMVPNDSSK